MSNTINIIFDTETLGVRENAVILSLSCVPFIFEKRDYFENYLKTGFKIKFNVKEQIQKYKRDVEKFTVDWWEKQDKIIRDENIKPSLLDVSLLDGLKSLSTYIALLGYDFNKSYVFSRGSYFDIPKIESLYGNVNLKLPFNSFKIRDVRTYIDILYGVDDGNYDVKLSDISKFKRKFK